MVAIDAVARLQWKISVAQLVRRLTVNRNPNSGLQIRAEMNLEEQAFLNLMRTADCLSRAAQRAIRPWGITSTQYNVLRILRGAQPTGATCSEIGQRMITADPDITRLLNRLKKLGLIGQQRDKNDRRIVRTQIRDKGLALLSEMDNTMKALPLTLLGHLSHKQLFEMIRLLDTVREVTLSNLI
jgi:DNA-binding MarR family transcriptional regulator